MTFMRANGVGRGADENGVTDFPAAVGHLVDAGGGSSPPQRASGPRPRAITSVDARAAPWS
jgi:hypothetical protein